MFNKLQQDEDCDKVEQKSKHVKRVLDVRGVKEIQPEQNIEEMENLMSDDVEVQLITFLKSLSCLDKPFSVINESYMSTLLFLGHVCIND